MRVVLTHMPWGALERPALGVSLLKAGLAGLEGVACEIRYFNMLFADMVGARGYHAIMHDLPHIAFAGEWVFSESLYGHDAARDRAFIDDILIGEWRLPRERIKELLDARASVETFLTRLVEEWDWRGVDLVGFTSTFEQNIASLSLARRLKARFPDMRICFGGANWEGEMGEELHRAFSFVDFAISGEADLSFPLLLRALRDGGGRGATLAKIPGLLWRRRGESVANGGAMPVTCMDDLPTPDFGDYFAWRSQSPAAMQSSPILLFESSRGCWWGAKSHCTFCGLNGHTIGFRSKSARRVLAELNELITRWPCPTLEAVDNILDLDYFDSVLPALERMNLPGPIFYEVKSNLKRRHIAALRRANVSRIQPGIESLGDHVLQLMRKGVTGLQNVQLLKWCREYDVAVDWNLLYGFPGETAADYDAITDTLYRIRHLPSPGACGPVRLDRFSPYFERPHDFGISNVRPMLVYRLIYPLDSLRHERVAYYFHFDYEFDEAVRTRVYRAAQYADMLRDAPEGGSLRALPHRDGGLYVSDTRDGAKVSRLKLSPFERCIVMRIDEVASVPQVMQALRLAFPECEFCADQVRAFLDELVELELALADGGGRYLGLILMPASLRLELEAAGWRVARSCAPRAGLMKAAEKANA